MTEPNQATILANYRRAIDQMKGRIFMVEDVDGLMRRWHPPTREVLEGEE